jgi:Ca2+-binding EF-hand superfamily protein
MLSYIDYQHILERIWEDYNPEELRGAVDAFDPNMEGVMTVEQLKKFLVDLGEPLTEQEFKEFIKSLPTSEDGSIITEG